MQSSTANKDLLSDKITARCSQKDEIPLGTVTYSSSNTSILTMNSNGLATTSKSAYGLPTITVRAGKYSATLKVMVVNAYLRYSATWNYYGSTEDTSSDGTIKADMWLALKHVDDNRWQIMGIHGGSYTNNPMLKYIKGITYDDTYWRKDFSSPYL